MDRRHFLQTAAVATATASLGSASSADAKSVHFDALAVVREMILAWRRQDLDAMLTHVADDIVWHTHVGSPPVVGKQAMHDFAAKLGASMHDIKWRIFEAAQHGDRIHLEGVDDFVTADGRRVTIPYAGIMAFRDGKVVEWRDYFDRATFDKLKAGEAMPDYLAALANRKPLF